MPPPPLPDTQRPASLVLPPHPDRSLRPRRALAQDHHAAACTNSAPPQSCLRARGPNHRRSLGGPLLGVLCRVRNVTARPWNARAESRSTAVSRRTCVTLHSRTSLRSTSAPQLFIDLLPAHARLTVFASLRQTSARPFVHMDSQFKTVDRFSPGRDFWLPDSLPTAQFAHHSFSDFRRVRSL